MLRIRIRLRDVLREKNLTQKDLSEKTGIAPSVISGIARGTRESLHLPTIEKIAAFLGVSPLDLLDTYDDGFPPPDFVKRA